jgi:hypothetical protein
LRDDPAVQPRLVEADSESSSTLPMYNPAFTG